MKNLIIEKKLHITASFNPDQWKISGDGAEDITIKLNKQLEFYVNNGYSKEEVASRMIDALSKNNVFDLESHVFLQLTLDKIFF